jgi:hypothetical protein
MGAPLERKLAVRMLKIRDRGGYGLGLFLRWNAKRYLFSIVYFGVALAYLAYAELWGLFSFALGLVAGMFLRDFGWVRAAAKSWPFTVRVTDWEEVQRIADEQPPG